MMKKAPALFAQPGTVPETCVRGIEMSDSICSIDGCDRVQFSRSLCGRHWWSFRHSSEWQPLAKPTTEERFVAKVEFTDTCWLWTAGKDRGGYGHFTNPGSQLAHRWSYEHFVGPIPEGMQLDHLCRVRHCVNPDHLEPVTPRENTLRSPVHDGAKRRAQTTCHNGHPFDYVSPTNGQRVCRQCKNAWQREYRRRKKDA